MKNSVWVLCIILVGVFTVQAYAGDGHSHEKKKHCEKKMDGKTIHLDQIKSRKECKQEGGRWVKYKKQAEGSEHKDHDHKEGDEHKH